MAKALVPPHGSCIIKCKRCKGLYMPETIKTDYNAADYDPCLFCGYVKNNDKNTIPIWMYNILKLFRSGKHVDDIEAGFVKFESIKKKKEPEELKTKLKSKYVYFIEPFKLIH